METAQTMSHEHEYATNSKGNTALGIGIAGLALGVLNTLGGGMALWNNSKSGETKSSNTCHPMNDEDAYIERKMAQNYIDVTKDFYQGKLDGQKQLADAFFDAYKRDVDNSFDLYKNHRDDFDKLNQKIVDASFQLYKNDRDGKDEVMGTIWATNSATNKKVDEIAFNLYKNQRDEKDALNEKISALQSKVDVMSAIRPYQDALINAKIDQNALISDFNLARRTCRMIEGDVVLPNDPTVTGFKSSSTCPCAN